MGGLNARISQQISQQVGNELSGLRERLASMSSVNLSPQQIEDLYNEEAARRTALITGATPTGGYALFGGGMGSPGMGNTFNPGSGPMTDEARVAMDQADAENRQALRDAGVNVEGLSPEQYQATVKAFGEWSNLPENRAYRNQRSAIGKFVDSIGGPAGLFALTAGGAFLAGGGLGAMGGAPATGAGAGATGAGTAGAAGAGTATVPGAAGGFFSPTGAGSALAGGTASGGAATGVANVGLVAGGGAGAAGAGAAGAGAINIGAGQAGGVLGGGAGAVSTSAPLTMGGLVGGTSPAAGAINIGAGAAGAAGAGAAAGAAGGAGMGGISGFLNRAGNFLSSPGGQLLSTLGEAGLGYLGQQDQMDLAQQLAEQARFQPYNVQGPLGAVTVEGQNINIAPTAEQQAFQESLFGLGTGAFGRAGDPTLQNIFAQTPEQLQQLTQQFIGEETLLPGAAATLEQQLAGLGGEALSLGRGMLTQETPSFNDLAAERLAALRAAARPEEERTTQTALENLFSQGRLGTTGGQRALGELARAQELADIGRITSAQDFAQTQQNIAAEQALARSGLGAELFGLGTRLPASIFEAQRAADTARLARGAQRIEAAQNLFGFGQGARAGELGMGLDIMAGLRSQYDPLIQLTNIASGMGGAQSLAAARGSSGVLGSFASPYDYGAGIFARYGNR